MYESLFQHTCLQHKFRFVERETQISCAPAARSTSDRSQRIVILKIWMNFCYSLLQTAMCFSAVVIMLLLFSIDISIKFYNTFPISIPILCVCLIFLNVTLVRCYEFFRYLKSVVSRVYGVLHRSVQKFLCQAHAWRHFSYRRRHAVENIYVFRVLIWDSIKFYCKFDV